MNEAPKTLTVEECNCLLIALKAGGCTPAAQRISHRNVTLALCMLEAGLRVGEVVRLIVSDLIFNAQPVRSIVLRSEIAKKGIERQIPVSSVLSNAINVMVSLIWSPDEALWDAPAFYSLSRGRSLTTRQVERIVRGAAIRGIGRAVHPHILRHTFATRLMRVTDIRTVQELLGHKSVTSTQIYTHPNEDDKRKAIDQVDKPPVIS